MSHDIFTVHFPGLTAGAHRLKSLCLEFLSMNLLRGSCKLLILRQGTFGHSGIRTLRNAKFKALWIRDSRYAATFRALGDGFELTP
jgi:hypothetical protein